MPLRWSAHTFHVPHVILVILCFFFLILRFLSSRERVSYFFFDFNGTTFLFARMTFNVLCVYFFFFWTFFRLLLLIIYIINNGFVVVAHLSQFFFIVIIWMNHFSFKIYVMMPPLWPQTWNWIFLLSTNSDFTSFHWSSSLYNNVVD